jgi:DeoR/GlpR family transcriptional regulator of sugar metabolism
MLEMPQKAAGSVLRPSMDEGEAGPRRLSKKARHERILAELRASPTIRIASLASQFGVSTETIRRDFEEMASNGLVDRTYGGAVARPLGFEPAWTERYGAMSAERDRIAAVAAALVQPGEALMIDGGTTALHFARRLAAVARDLAVVTNSLPVAQALGANPGFRVICCPGALDAREGIVAGPETLAFLDRFQANRAVVGASGLTVEGPTEINSGAAAVKRAMFRRAAERILLLDHAKFEKPNLEVVCPLADVNRLVSDAPPPPALAAALAEAGTEVLH